ncbi:aspartyl/asparaginyl beta-hydroxylase domain-containing protein [Micromonospora sp. NPDC005172]|uniref:aspartyl/asparaginyl beta-hydroxylase domain-containing protein n=1 Tax=Micromonospora sp. NPDC005172 TaxID=3156867 RepID=UPI0033B8B27F
MLPSERPALAEAARLTPSFDADRLACELADVTGHRWQHQRIHAVGGDIGAAATIDWRVLPLRSPDGDADRTDPGGPGPIDFAPTEWLRQLPYLREILAAVPAPLNAVRLMALGPGATSRPHRDPKYALSRGLVRLHIPLVTHEDAVLVLDGVEHCWQPGQFWYGDFSRQHLVRNTGPVTRIHAVIDALFTAELAALFPTAWQVAFADTDILFNRPTPPPAPCPVTLPHTVHVPRGFTDFDNDQPLDGPPELARVDAPDGRLTLSAAGRVFALTPVGPDEYRFAGWSEQRSLELTPGETVLYARRGRSREQHRLPVPANLL